MTFLEAVIKDRALNEQVERVVKAANKMPLNQRRAYIEQEVIEYTNYNETGSKRSGIAAAFIESTLQHIELLPNDKKSLVTQVKLLNALCHKAL